MRKLFASVLTIALISGCASKTDVVKEIVPSETAASISEGTTTAEVTENTHISTQETSESAVTDSSVSKEFFDDDVVFEEMYLPVKWTQYFSYDNGPNITQYEYDIAGNLIREYNPGRNIKREYGYNTDGTYNAVLKYFDNELIRTAYDKRGYCTQNDRDKYEYKFDEQDHLIRKSSRESYLGNITEDITEYSYDKSGRLSEECDYEMYNDNENITRYRHEYSGNTENVYIKDNDEEEVMYLIRKRDNNGRVIYESNNFGARNKDCEGSTIVTYEYDDKDRVIYENHDTTEGFHDGGSDRCYNYSYAYEYDGDILKKYIYCYWGHTDSTEYFYEGDRIIKELRTFSGGSDDVNGNYPGEYLTEYKYEDDGAKMIKKSYGADGTLLEETEYAYLKKIKTDIQYLTYYEIHP